MPCCVDAAVESLAALRLMAERDIGAVLVRDGDRIAGVFSERDFARNSARVAQFAVTTPVRDAMTPCDVSVTPAALAHECLQLMSAHQLRYLPVEEAGQFVAMLSLDDLLNEIVAHQQSVLKAIQLDQQILFLRGTYSC